MTQINKTWHIKNQTEDPILSITCQKHDLPRHYRLIHNIIPYIVSESKTDCQIEIEYSGAYVGQSDVPFIHLWLFTKTEVSLVPDAENSIYEICAALINAIVLNASEIIKKAVKKELDVSLPWRSPSVDEIKAIANNAILN